MVIVYFTCHFRGSLYRLLHKPSPKEALDERRRLSMAYDVVCIQIFLLERKTVWDHNFFLL